MEPTNERVESGDFSAEPIPYDLTKADGAETVCGWLLTAPRFSPAWDQYFLVCVRLRDGVPGFPEPKRQFEGATHEIIVGALNPVRRYTGASLAAGQSLPFLQPLNVVVQFEGTDEEMRDLVSLMAQGVVYGFLSPEPALAGDNSAWLSAGVKTLAHIRGEEHAP